MISEAVPVMEVTVEAFTTPEVFPFKLFNTSAASVVSLTVTTSLPRPVIVPAVFDAYAVLTSEAAPVSVIEVTSTATVVFPLSVFKLEAETEESVTEIVNAFPDSVIPSKVDISLSLTVAVKMPLV